MHRNRGPLGFRPKQAHQYAWKRVTRSDLDSVFLISAGIGSGFSSNMKENTNWWFFSFSVLEEKTWLIIYVIGYGAMAWGKGGYPD